MKRLVVLTTLALIGSLGLAAPPALAEPESAFTNSVISVAQQFSNAITPLSTDDTIWYVDDTGNNTNDCLSPTSGGDSVGPCLTIQAAIDKAGSGDTIQVAAGTYVENLAIDEAVTLKCSNAGISAGVNPGTRVAETTIQGEANISVSETTVDGCSFIRPDVPANTVPKLVESIGVTGAVTIRNTQFDMRIHGSEPASRGCAAALWGRAAWKVQDNSFANQFYSNGSSSCGSSGNLYNSRVVWADGAQPIQVAGNRFTNIGQGVYLTSNQPSGSIIESNVFDPGAGLAVLVGSASDVTVRGNTFASGNSIYLDSSQTISIENNLFCGGAGGGAEAPGSFPQCTGRSTGRTASIIWSTGSQAGSVVRNNAILGGYQTEVVAPFGGRAVFNYGAASLDVRNNWWGTGFTDDSIAAKLYVNPGALPFSPWIETYTDNPSKAGQPGFWPIIPTQEATTPESEDSVAVAFNALLTDETVGITFPSVTSPGVTTVTAYDPAKGTPNFPTPPAGFSLGNPPVYYTFETTATVGTPIQICLGFDPASFAGQPPLMYHFTDEAWVTLTTSVTGLTACAFVDDFSPFALGVPIQPPPPSNPPSAPLSVSGEAGDAQATASWLAPADSGSFPISTYQAEALPGGATCLAVAPALTCTITGLTNGTAYTLRARALNGAGWGPWSTPSDPITPGPSTPGAPSNVAAVAGNGAADVSWAAPTDPGSAPITGYRIEQSQADGPWVVAIADTGSTATLATVGSLMNGESYRFRVSAINAGGVGAPSAPSAPVTPEEPEERSILITGARVSIAGKPAIRIRGEASGFESGDIVRVWIRRPGKPFREQRAEIAINDRGTFAWRKRIAPRVVVYVQAADGTRSNRVVIPAR